MVNLLHISSCRLMQIKEQVAKTNCVSKKEWLSVKWSGNTVAMKSHNVLMADREEKRKWDRERKRGGRLSTHSRGNKVLSRKQRWLPGRWITLRGGRWGLELLHINHWARTLWKIPAVLMEKRRRGQWLERGSGGLRQRHPNPQFTLVQWSQGLAASRTLRQYISLFQGCWNETSGLKNHTVCGSINTSSPTMATQQLSVTKHSDFFLLLSLHFPNSLLKSYVLFIPITPTFTHIQAHRWSFNQNLSTD